MSFLTESIYETNRKLNLLYGKYLRVSAIIDALTKVLFSMVRQNPDLKIYRDSVLRLIIKDYLLIGRVVVDYFVEDKDYKIYDSNMYQIFPVRKYPFYKIMLGDMDITVHTIYLKNSAHSSDFMGRSVLSEDGLKIDADLGKFQTELSNSLSMRIANTGEYVQ